MAHDPLPTPQLELQNHRQTELGGCANVSFFSNKTGYAALTYDPPTGTGRQPTATLFTQL